MRAWIIAASLIISLSLIIGLQSNGFADSEDGSKSCPFKGDKTNYQKNTLYSYEKHQSDEVTNTLLGENHVPSWIKTNAKWWATGQLSDTEFTTGIKFLIENDFITITNTEISQTTTSNLQTPLWVKTTAAWWADGLVSDTEFVSGLEHLINTGVI